MWQQFRHCRRRTPTPFDVRVVWSKRRCSWRPDGEWRSSIGVVARREPKLARRVVVGRRRRSAGVHECARALSPSHPVDVAPVVCGGPLALHAVLPVFDADYPPDCTCTGCRRTSYPGHMLLLMVVPEPTSDSPLTYRIAVTYACL